MKEKRAFHKDKINSHREMLEKKQNNIQNNEKVCNLTLSNDGDIEGVFDKIVLPKKRKIDDLYKKKTKKVKDENYIPYVPSDKHTEEG